MTEYQWAFWILGGLGAATRLALTIWKAHADAARSDPRTREKLNRLLASPDEPVRRSAVETLGALWPEAKGGT